MEFLFFLWHHCHPRVVVSVLCLARRYKCLFHISLLPLAGAVSSRMVPYPYVALVRTVTFCHRSDTLCSSVRARPQVLPETRKNASVMCLDAVLGKVPLPYWRFIVVRHGGNVHRDVYCILFLR